ncbi:MAG: hypothetical protein JSS66_05310 [Armatimonadetes bacterium]|nr:hypothetical protein [Armatimonadota bacterium]
MRTAMAAVVEETKKTFAETENFEVKLVLTDELAKRVAALCTMMKAAYGTEQAETLAYILSVGMANIRQPLDETESGAKS